MKSPSPKQLAILCLVCAIIYGVYKEAKSRSSCPSSDNTNFKNENGKCVFDTCKSGFTDIPFAADGKISHTCIPEQTCNSTNSTKYKMKNGKCSFDGCQDGCLHVPVAADGKIVHKCLCKSK